MKNNVFFQCSKCLQIKILVHVESTFFSMPTSFISKFDRFIPIDVPCMEFGDVSNAIDETNISSGPI